MIYVGHTGKLDIVIVLLVAFCGAIIGDNFAFLAGRKLGFRLLRRHGHYIRLNEKRLKFIQYLYLRYGIPIERALPGSLRAHVASDLKPERVGSAH